jgi:UDP-glucose 4-epimerase
VFVDDVARLIDRVVSNRTTGVLNVATGRTATFEHVARLVAAAVPWHVEIARQPREIPVMHRDFDVSAVSRAFPDFRYTPIEQGVALTAATLDPRQTV